MNEGFVKLPRNITSWRWFSDANVLKVYIYLLTKAAFKETKWKKETLKKGQLVTGRKKLADALEISESSITRILKKLESTGDISLKANNKYTVITLLDWEKTQSCDYFFNNQRTTNEQQADNKRTQYNKEKNVNNAKNYNARKRAKNKTGIIDSIDWSKMEEIISGS